MVRRPTDLNELVVRADVAPGVALTVELDGLLVVPFSLVVVAQVFRGRQMPSIHGLLVELGRHVIVLVHPLACTRGETRSNTRQTHTHDLEYMTAAGHREGVTYYHSLTSVPVNVAHH